MVKFSEYFGMRDALVRRKVRRRVHVRVKFPWESEREIMKEPGEFLDYTVGKLTEINSRLNFSSVKRYKQIASNTACGSSEYPVKANRLLIEAATSRTRVRSSIAKLRTNGPTPPGYQSRSTGGRPSLNAASSCGER